MPNGIAIAAVIAIVVIGLIVVVQMIALAALFFILKNLAEEMRERLDPLIARTNALLITLTEMTQSMQGKAEHIADTTAHTTDLLADRIDRLSGLLQRMVGLPIIGAAAMMEGVASGIGAWRGLRRRRRRGTPVPAERPEQPPAA